MMLVLYGERTPELLGLGKEMRVVRIVLRAGEPVSTFISRYRRPVADQWVSVASSTSLSAQERLRLSAKALGVASHVSRDHKALAGDVHELTWTLVHQFVRAYEMDVAFVLEHVEQPFEALLALAPTLHDELDLCLAGQPDRDVSFDVEWASIRALGIAPECVAACVLVEAANLSLPAVPRSETGVLDFFEKRFGIPRERMARAIKELVSARILRQTEAGLTFRPEPTQAAPELEEGAA